MAVYRVEKLGGLAGFGGPLSRVKSVGQMDESALDEPVRQFLRDRFASTSSTETMGRPDEFQYKITLETSGVEKTIILPESQTPLVIRQSVRDEFA
ncbi:MAG: protealysin inhibitor emfourin [bacterium]